MSFTPEQAKILQDHLQERRLVCPLCADERWNLVEIVALPIHHNKGLGQVVPVALAACAACAYVMQFAWLLVLEARERKHGR